MAELQTAQGATILVDDADHEMLSGHTEEALKVYEDEEERELTKDERNWVTRLKKCLNAMPKTLEVSVKHDCVSIHDRGASDSYFAEHEHTDNVPELDSISTFKVAFIPNGESL